MFPLASKPNAMSPELPIEVVHNLAGERIHRLRNGCVMSHAEGRRIENQDVGCSDSDASRRRSTFVCTHRIQSILQITLGNPQVADESRRDDGGDSTLKLSCPSACGEPVG